MKGIDISKYQKDIDLSRAKEFGYDFAMVRCGDGTKKDSHFYILCDRVMKAGLYLGVYHFSRAKTVKYVQKECKLIAEMINGLPVRMPITLDMELGLDKVMSTSIFNQFRKEMENYFGKNVETMLYTNQHQMTHNFAYPETITEHSKLWIARYSNKQPQVGLPVFMWQYTSDADSEDFYTEKLDRNIVLGDIDDLRSMGNDGIKEPEVPIEETGKADMVKKAVAGVYGNGEKRKYSLGKYYDEVQSLVNKYLKVAYDTCAGKYGNEPKRSEKWRAEGLDPSLAQWCVNWILRK